MCGPRCPAPYVDPCAHRTRPSARDPTGSGRCIRPAGTTTVAGASAGRAAMRVTCRPNRSRTAPATRTSRGSAVSVRHCWRSSQWESSSRSSGSALGRCGPRGSRACRPGRAAGARRREHSSRTARTARAGAAGSSCTCPGLRACRTPSTIRAASGSGSSGRNAYRLHSPCSGRFVAGRAVPRRMLPRPAAGRYASRGPPRSRGAPPRRRTTQSFISKWMLRFPSATTRSL